MVNHGILNFLTNEAYEDCLKALEINDGDGKMKLRKFILIKKEELEATELTQT